MVSTIADGSAGRLRGKAAIITGAARGIGRATAVAFARAGADVMGIDIAGPVSSTLDVVPATTDELAETGRLVGAAGARWCEARLDQPDLAALRAAAEKANATFGRLDNFSQMLVYRASRRSWIGMMPIGTIPSMSTSQVPVTPFALLRRFWSRMAADASSSRHRRRVGTAPNMALPILRPNGALSA